MVFDYSKNHEISLDGVASYSISVQPSPLT